MPGGRARHIRIGVGRCGPLDAITDVAGVRVGHATLIEGSGRRRTGEGPVRTGVTVVLPNEDIWREPVMAGAERINGTGELTGLEWMRDCGYLTTPIAITNTHSVGVVRDALAEEHIGANAEVRFSLPVVGETFDGLLSDINGHHVTAEHVRRALDDAADGPVAEGSVGGGTGMICHEFKGGIGTASRVVDADGDTAWTVGVLVQANHGVRERLTVDGVPVGRMIGPERVPLPAWDVVSRGAGSIIVVVATDAPLLPHQCAALAKRSSFGLARTGGAGEHDSGDFAIAFSTANRATATSGVATMRTVLGDMITPLYWATVEATEQAIVSALVAAKTMTGADGKTVHELPVEELESILRSASQEGGTGSEGR